MKISWVVVLFSVLCLISLCGGLLFFAYVHEWIIICGPPRTNYPLMAERGQQKKLIKCFFWHDHRWHGEEVEVLVSSDVAATLTSLVNRWLTVLSEESVFHRKIVLQNISVTGAGQCAYISFDRSLFNKELSCFDKWMLIEGLLRTIREGGMVVSSVQVLVNHRICDDYHLDLSYPLPIQGFMS
jgi:hypothetical protein